jgi:hypothetical protein
MPDYPRTVTEVINPNAKYKPAVLAALREFRDLKPWRGTVEQRKHKFRFLHDRLCLIYGKQTRLTFDVPEAEQERGNGCYFAGADEIKLIGKLSVVTYLHEFAHALFGRSERKACEWSINLYKRIFPRSAARMTTDGHLIVKP